MFGGSVAIFTACYRAIWVVTIRVGVAIDAALRHARTLGVDKDIVAEIQALKEIDPADHPSLRGASQKKLLKLLGMSDRGHRTYG